MSYGMDFFVDEDGSVKRNIAAPGYGILHRNDIISPRDPGTKVTARDEENIKW